MSEITPSDPIAIVRGGKGRWLMHALFIATAACSDTAHTGDHDVTARSEALSSDTLLATSHVTTPNGIFTFDKHLGDDGKVYELVQDANGFSVDPASVSGTPSSPIGTTLQLQLQQLTRRGASVLVDISLRDDILWERAPGGADVEGMINQSSEPKGNINGASAGAAELAADTARIAEQLGSYQAKRRDLRRRLLRTLAQRGRLELSSREQTDYADALGPIVRTIAAADVERLAAENRDVIAAIELHQEGKDLTLATAMADTSADPGARQLPTSQGAGIGVYLTESGCPPTNFLTNYTLLAGTDTNHSRNTTSILRGVSPNAWIYCRGGAMLPTATDLAGTVGNPRVHIVSRSNGADGAEYNSVDRDWDNLTYANFVIAAVSAGNSGNATTVVTPAKALNVIAVGNYNDATDTIDTTSSGGEPTNTRNNKPELSAPGMNINAGGFTMSGTSMAAPHVAGLMADAMQAYSWLQFRPAIAKSHALAAATDSIAGGSGAVGQGGSDYLSGYYSFHDFWWWGPNSYFDTVAASDSIPGNGAVDLTYAFSAGQNIRIALAWPNNGTFTFDHRNDPHPIGIDLDLYVWAPDGSFVRASASWDDPHEVVNFTAPQTGVYRIEIRRFANRDTNGMADMGLTINW